MNYLLLVATALAASPVLAQSSEETTALDAGAPAPPPPDVSKLPLTSDSIRLVMAYHQPKIQGCYEDLLARREKPIQGKLITAFVITGEGLVKKPRVLRKGTTLRESRLHDCVVAVLASMEFPRPKDGREQPVEYPFNLKAIK